MRNVSHRRGKLHGIMKASCCLQLPFASINFIYHRYSKSLSITTKLYRANLPLHRLNVASRWRLSCVAPSHMDMLARSRYQISLPQENVALLDQSALLYMTSPMSASTAITSTANSLRYYTGRTLHNEIIPERSSRFLAMLFCNPHPFIPVRP